ncbi:hypothetical protein F4809DRAFT_516179 [Biscogniauxia mediterranea]|nr:hypothetical protein F4809DRAFT_516179 [Biscogniauxia mediterranea]
MVTTRSARKATASPSPIAASFSSSFTTSSSKTPSRSSRGAKALWTHAPSRATLAWLAVSLPLVVWDTAYVLLRPLTMEGGSLHWPLWVPYKLYGEVDHVYGWKAFEARSGFTAAQGALNAVETVMYLAYVWVYLFRSTHVATKAGDKKRVLAGRPAALAVLIAFSAAVMTLSKTVLYWLNEYFSGFDNIGHNSRQDLVLLWIIPNGAWLIFPTYMIYAMGGEIVAGLTAASTGVPAKSE